MDLRLVIIYMIRNRNHNYFVIMVYPVLNLGMWWPLDEIYCKTPGGLGPKKISRKTYILLVK